MVYYVVYGTDRDVERNEVGLIKIDERERAIELAKKMSEHWFLTSVIEDPPYEKIPRGGRFITSFWNKELLKRKLEEVI